VCPEVEKTGNPFFIRHVLSNRLHLRRFNALYPISRRNVFETAKYRALKLLTLTYIVFTMVYYNTVSIFVLKINADVDMSQPILNDAVKTA
jgi:hypothetical protein